MRAVPRCAVFQAGWAGVPDEWRQLSEEDSAAWRSVLGIRAELNQLLEKARADKALGASLEAKVRRGGGGEWQEGASGQGVRAGAGGAVRSVGVLCCWHRPTAWTGHPVL